MPTSLLKYASRRNVGGGNKLHWDRADVDGLPFRGPAAPMLTESEYQEQTIRVADYKNGFFDVTDPAQNKKFLEVMECCANGWFYLYFIDRFWKESTKHYVEWIEYYMEDGRRTPYQASGAMEVPANG